MRNYILRNVYLQKLIDRRLNGDVKVITGPRRCGKSWLLTKIYKDYLIEDGVKPENIIIVSFDLEDDSNKSELTDKELHKLIDTLNPGLRTIETFDGKERTKEFYAMSPEDAYSLIECIAKISGTTDQLKRMKPEGHEIADEQLADTVKAESRRGPVLFTKIGIPVGAELQFIDDNNVKVKVVDDRHIEYNGETTSLSALARQLKGFEHQVQGTLWFSYNGKRISDIRDEYDQNKQ